MSFRFDDFTLDTGGRRLLRDRQEVPLSPKAFLLLELLVSKRPDAVSKAAIQDVIWPSTHVVEANIANLVGEIRVALADHRHQSRYIRTVARFGYAFIGGDDAAAENGPAFTLVRGNLERRLRSGINDLGRSNDDSRMFDSTSVSRKHARIVVHGDSAVIEDLGSKNGTFVGTTRVVTAIALRNGDVVKLGSVTATFRCSAGDDVSTLILPRE